MIESLVEQLPLEVRYGRCVVEAERLEVLEQVLELVSVLSVGSVLFLFRRYAQDVQATGPPATAGPNLQRHKDRRRYDLLLELFRSFEAAGSSSVWCRQQQLAGLKTAKDMKSQLLGAFRRLGIVVTV